MGIRIVQRRTLLLAAVLALGLTTAAGATVVPGDGPAKSDCYIVLDTKGTATLSHHALTCTDGDPACDGDGACNDSCLFNVRICVNKPGLPGCTPPASLSIARVSHDAIPVPVMLAGSACGAFVPETVPVKVSKKGKKKPGKLKFTARAMTT